MAGNRRLPGGLRRRPGQRPREVPSGVSGAGSAGHPSRRRRRRRLRPLGPRPTGAAIIPSPSDCRHRARLARRTGPYPGSGLQFRGVQTGGFAGVEGRNRTVVGGWENRLNHKGTKNTKKISVPFVFFVPLWFNRFASQIRNPTAVSKLADNQTRDERSEEHTSE